MAFWQHWQWPEFASGGLIIVAFWCYIQISISGGILNGEYYSSAIISKKKKSFEINNIIFNIGS
jgi:hypothetical protein